MSWLLYVGLILFKKINDEAEIYKLIISFAKSAVSIIYFLLEYCIVLNRKKMSLSDDRLMTLIDSWS